jgi:hypothetical protein
MYQNYASTKTISLGWRQQRTEETIWDISGKARRKETNRKTKT